jgi:RHS repeat-associated protein
MDTTFGCEQVDLFYCATGQDAGRQPLINSCYNGIIAGGGVYKSINTRGSCRHLGEATESCGNGRDDNASGCVDEGCEVGTPPCTCVGFCVNRDCSSPPVASCVVPTGGIEMCGNVGDDDCDGSIDEGCEPPTAADPDEAGGESCMDTGGEDPIIYSTRSAVTEPFTDFRFDGHSPLGITRTYQSADWSVRGNGSPGIFGRGWHHDWEATISCALTETRMGPATQCIVNRGLRTGLRFLHTESEAYSPILQENVTIYSGIVDPRAPNDTGYILVQRRNDEWILYWPNGKEWHFSTVCDTCGDLTNPVCKSPFQGGMARLTKVVDPAGNAVTVSYDWPNGVLLGLRDDLGRELVLKGPQPTRACGSRVANTLQFRESQESGFETYATYSYLGDSLVQATDANALLMRSYVYEKSRPAYLTAVKNESGAAIAEFGYDPITGYATSLIDSKTTLSVSYPDDATTSTVASPGSARSSSGQRSHGGSGVVSASGINIGWLRKKLGCFRDAEGRVDWYDRDGFGRVTRHARYKANPTFTCNGSDPDPADLVDEESYEYGLERTIATANEVNFVVPLSRVTRLSRKSAVSNTGLAEGVTDYDLASKPSPLGYDPAGYSCGPSTLPRGSVTCRRIESGYTTSVTGAVTRERHYTFFSYDSRGRLVKTIGPINVDRSSAGDVTPIEERVYWPDTESALRRGRLKDVRRYASSTGPLTYSIDYAPAPWSRAFGPMVVQDPDGRSTTYNRDSRGRVVSRVGADNRTIRLRYYDGNSPRLVLFDSGATRRASYDGRGRLRSVERIYGDPDVGPVTIGDSQLVTYDDAGNPQFLERRTSANAIRWSRTLDSDPDHRLRSELHPDDPTKWAAWDYDASGVLKLMTDEEGRRIEFIPDPLGRPKDVVGKTPVGEVNQLSTTVASYVYEAGQDAVRSVTDGAGRTTTNAHDDFGLVSKVVSDGTGLQLQYEFDARGNVRKRTGGRVTVVYTYDALDRLIGIQATKDLGGLPVSVTLTYDLVGQKGRLRSIVETGRTTTFTWDPVGRLRYESVVVSGQTSPRVTEYRYDVDGYLDTIVYPSGLAVTHDRDDATKEVTAVREAGSNRPFMTEIQREPFGPMKSAFFGNTLALNQTYNLRYEPETISSGPVSLTYGVSPAGDVGGVFEGSTPSGYGHDYLDRLTSFSPGHGTGESLRYEYVGDRIIAAWTTGTPSVRRKAFGYDAQMNLSSISTYDAAGTTITQMVCLVHDALGRLAVIGKGSSTAGGPNVIACQTEAAVTQVFARFEYDALNRRVLRTAGATKTYFSFLPGGETIGEYVPTGVTTAPWRTIREYVWLDGRPIAQEEHPTTTERYTYAVHVDHIGLPRALTNAAGQTVWRATARPYGDIDETVTLDAGRTVVTNLRLPGQYDERLLASVGLQGPYYNWNRWYLPSVGRYLELDPIAKAGGFNGFFGPNWYGYAEGNPLRWTDSDGLQVPNPVPIPWPTVPANGPMSPSIGNPWVFLVLGLAEGYNVFKHWNDDVLRPDPFMGPGPGLRKRGNQDPPWKSNYKKHNPGRGPGGDCLPCDPPSPTWNHTDGTVHRIIFDQLPNCECRPNRTHC